jgi:hypothetical protein
MKTKNFLKHKRIYMIFALMFFGYGLCSAEYNHELGLSGGTAFYLGDANHVTPFNRARWTAGAFYRYNIDTRWAVKLDVNYAEVEGDTRDFGYILPNGQEYAKFERGFVDIQAAVEFNFFDIGENSYYKSKFDATPYIMIGIGLCAYNNLYGGSSMYELSIPFAIGGKWKINQRMTLGIQWSIHKLFTDKFDVTNESNKILNNPTGAPKVGFLDTDFYSLANISLSVNLFDTKKYCR